MHDQETIAGVAIARTPAALRAWRQRVRDGGRTLGLVPTMGALHAGHLALVDVARARADAVAVTIFVNPLQFGPKEDLSRYPRQLEADCAACATRGVDLVFVPDHGAMYPPGFATEVRVAALASRWEGASRPGHFAGVATVVAKLLNLALAELAVFGEKDWQQLQVIRRLAADLDQPTVIVGAPIVRDADGLALSSRNVYLSADERSRAGAIPRALAEAQALGAAGETDARALADRAARAITAAGGRLDYAAIVDAETLDPVGRIDRPARAIVAAWFGAPKLLDNCPIGPGVAAAGPGAVAPLA